MERAKRLGPRSIQNNVKAENPSFGSSLRYRSFTRCPDLVFLPVPGSAPEVVLFHSMASLTDNTATSKQATTRFCRPLKIHVRKSENRVRGDFTASCTNCSSSRVVEDFIPASSARCGNHYTEKSQLTQVSNRPVTSRALADLSHPLAF
jgi:hypothetical protein